MDAELRFYDAAEDTFTRLADMPGLGHERPELAPDRLPSLRSYPIRGFENWLVFYLPTRDAIDIIRILHGARNLADVLQNNH